MVVFIFKKIDIILYFLHSIVLLLCVTILNARGRTVVRSTLEKRCRLGVKISIATCLILTAFVCVNNQFVDKTEKM